MSWGTLENAIFCEAYIFRNKRRISFLVFSSILWSFVKMFPEFPNPALIFKLPVALPGLKMARVHFMGRAQFFFFYKWSQNK